MLHSKGAGHKEPSLIWNACAAHVRAPTQITILKDPATLTNHGTNIRNAVLCLGVHLANKQQENSGTIPSP